MGDREILVRIIDDIIRGTLERDLEKLMGYYAEDAFTIGTGKLEITEGLDQHREHWRISFEGVKFKFNKLEIRNLKQVGNVALFDTRYLWKSCKKSKYEL